MTCMERKNTSTRIGTKEMKIEELEEMAIEFRRLKTDFGMMAALVEEIDDFLRMLEDHHISEWDSEISEMRSHTRKAMKEILSANDRGLAPAANNQTVSNE